ncbi:MAG TPA: ribosome biogenesis GTPase Der, partial [Victivallales bacterium]|nr:ribosome biogenesis GTPase Der [Victivallales bacterium]
MGSNKSGKYFIVNLLRKRIEIRLEVENSDLKIPVVAIVGRPNVGKSSLFNAIQKRRTAIVHSESGVTRDRITGLCEFRDRKFQLVDTGGLSLYEGQNTKDLWSKEIRRQVEAAIESADNIIFVVEAGEPLPLDQDIARKLRTSGKRIILAVNKADNESGANTVANFARLGFDKAFPISCVHRTGLDELLAELTKDFKQVKVAEDDAMRIAIAGRPNVGKSSLINRILNEQRMMVSEIPGTTRDAVETNAIIRSGGRELKIAFVDTAGLRQKRKADSPVEIFSIDRTEKAIQKANIIILILEPFFDGASAQDRRIGGMIRESGKA